jgi:hypothetical protein
MISALDFMSELDAEGENYLYSFDEQLNQIAIVLETISDVGEKEWLKAYVKF